MMRRRPLHVAAEISGQGHHPALRSPYLPHTGPDRWVELTDGPPLDLAARPVRACRVCAADLRAAQRERELIRADVTAEGRDPNTVAVLLDIDTLIAVDTRHARLRLAELDAVIPAVLLGVTYIGTPAGLTGLIRDVQAAQVADGVTLRPLDGGETLDLIVRDVVPTLGRTLGLTA
jgi:alkanesulfonate monooxygenase SsuD/methylene tetrahydromethanopterin reductase-like flavin-dependent oxidoreductase (luciferase family)